ncbi:hypothetical protein FLACHUCJ7_00031 [Flavobacterium chungangense]|uniref:Uncharacterized protein n=1 Tax=Flavobacterium chungangense TaxID=554283 RepID=A0A6V6YM06_9FLAO|nr:hypothetical protein FLACHUCJ7_00031 [Flavobacterium chungangense]
MSGIEKENTARTLGFVWNSYFFSKKTYLLNN